MKKITLSSYLRVTTLLLSSVLLTACGGSDDTDTTPPPVADTNPAICTSDSSEINLEALLTVICNNLSDYNLFADATDPTINPNGRGIPFTLNTPLFTDYATKYRFVFVPENLAASYSEHEVMDFPVGTVLVKTFSLPADTSDRDGAETHIETRLLINRETGWLALPYYWETTSDATKAIAGKTVAASLVHKGETMEFDYIVPQASACTSCHAILPGKDSGETATIFKPIGPKARFLNNNYTYPDNTTENQLTHWVNEGILTGTFDTDTINTAATYSDTTDYQPAGGVSPADLENAAFSYLDINCAHCHRSDLTIGEYGGAAGGSGLNVEYNRVFDDNPTKFGVCKGAVAGGYSDYPFDVIPGYSELSYLVFRMNTLNSRHKMPELGRSTIHTEGVDLISAWIDAMPLNDCGVDVSAL
jgi:uncharacterized repeat protein (TIGR03806 family)